MRKFLGLLMAMIFLFTSCERLPNMNEVLAYQEREMIFNVHIEDGGQFDALVELSEGRVTVTLEGDPLTEGISFFLTEEDKISISYDGVTFSLPDGVLIKAKEWLSLFRLPSDALWRIRKDTRGGISIFVCECSERDVTLYLDTSSFLPLKITMGEVSVDILSAKEH